MATFDEFLAVEMRVGRIIEATEAEGTKKPAYWMKIDFGPFGIKQSSAQITELYTTADLIGRQVVCVTNFPVKKVAGFASEVLVLGVDTPKGVVLLSVDRPAALGERVH